MATIKKVKEINENCLIVYGGANAGIEFDDNKVFLSQQKNIDYVVGRANASSNARGQIIGDKDGFT